MRRFPGEFGDLAMEIMYSTRESVYLSGKMLGFYPGMNFPAGRINRPAGRMNHFSGRNINFSGRMVRFNVEMG
jgi:hypothetical protein